ncbi:hypothetical protein P280DRAFT_467278 [Massarina eburnea CBS 473.64]|uniref:WSC domain-containing protein n=1 Tax=Massarina eburnea CBS 473.64 TaxID=1395130 RepID=A0A6A6S8A0_9PLEO|nr:hypothetical protein P280DRAFT_467278 [Massarina eburnea CBS 473.64]
MLGCFQASKQINETHLERLLGKKAYKQRVGNLTHEYCLELCEERKDQNGNDGRTWRYFGIEFGRDCRCSQHLYFDVEDEPEKCTSHLTGDYEQLGGGAGYITVYQDADWVDDGSETDPDDDDVSSFRPRFVMTDVCTAD